MKGGYNMISINPTQKLNFKINYVAEYTNELELDQDYENIKQVKAKDLEELISVMFRLRKQDRHNISIGHTIENDENWFIEDYAYNLEFLTDSKLSDQLELKLYKQNETISEILKELGLYQDFLIKYKAMDKFQEFKKGDV
jgi:hypothetical protein